MNGNFNYVSYMRELAKQLNELRHSVSDSHFSRISGISDLEEFLQNQKRLNGFQMLVISTKSGSLVHNGDNLLDNGYFTFFILKQTPDNDPDQIEKDQNDCETIAKKIIGRYIRDSKLPLSDVLGFQKHTVSYDSTGPWLHNWYGFMVSFTLLDFPNITYNSEDWLDG